MKKIGKILFRLFLILLVVSGLGLGGYYGYQWWQNQELQKTRPTVVKAKDGTNINAAWHKLPAYQKNCVSAILLSIRRLIMFHQELGMEKMQLFRDSFQLKAIILKQKSGILPIA